MTSKQLATSFCISSKVNCPGKDYLDVQRTKSITTSRRRKLRHHLKNCAKATPASSFSSWSTAARSNLSKSPTTAHASTSSRDACRGTHKTLASLTTPGSRTGSPKIKRLSRTVCSTSSARSPRLTHLVAAPTPQLVIKATVPQRRRETLRVWSLINSTPSSKPLLKAMAQLIAHLLLPQNKPRTLTEVVSSKKLPNKCSANEEVCQLTRFNE